MPASKNITVYQGDTFSLFFKVRTRVFDPGTSTWVPGAPVDLTGYTGKAQIRSAKGQTSGTPALADFTVTIPDQSVVDNKGSVLLQLTAVQTTGLQPAVIGTNPTGYWDVQLTSSGGEVRTYLAGDVRVEQQVTV